MATHARFYKLLLTAFCLLLFVSCSKETAATKTEDTHFKSYYSFEKDGTVYAEVNLKFDEEEEHINWMQIDVYSYREFYELLAGTTDPGTVYETYADADWALSTVASGGSSIYFDCVDEKGNNLHKDTSFTEFMSIGDSMPFNAFKIYIDMTPQPNGIHYAVTNRRKRAFEILGLSDLYDKSKGSFKNDTSLLQGKKDTLLGFLVNQ